MEAIEASGAQDGPVTAQGSYEVDLVGELARVGGVDGKGKRLVDSRGDPTFEDEV